MKVHQTTIKDIAKILGISASTVSRALKDHPDICEKTKESVRRVAASVNYRPNTLALSLRKAKTNVIGVIVPEMTHHFFSSVLSGMDGYAFEHGYTTMICQSSENAQHELAVLQSLIDSRVDGILISLSKQTTDVRMLSDIISDGMPVVMFDRVLPGIEASSVTTNDFKGAYDAVSLMLKNGRRCVGLLCGDPTLTVSNKRREGYEAALRDAGIPLDESIIFDADTPEKLTAIEPVIAKKIDSIDGLFIINDFTAAAALKMLRKMGKNVPDDIGVVGFGDDPLAAMLVPSLTSVEQHGFEMGRTAMQLLIDQIESGLVVSKPVVKVLDSKLILRDSTLKK